MDTGNLNTWGRRAAAGACLLFISLLATDALHAQDGGENLRVYHVVMEPGEMVWEQFGHNAIWIHDAERGTDLAYNYGLFDFEQEGFLLRFIRGRMLYWMQGVDMQLTVQVYARDRRQVMAQELNLTPEQRVTLRDFLVWNERPENRYYRYDYFRDNCSTRVRDALDRALGGQIRAQTEGSAAGATYRDHSVRLTAEDLPVSFGLNLGLGPATDRPLSAWEEMFIPMQMRDHLRELTVLDEQGNRVPLVREERVLFASDRPPPPDEVPTRWPGFLLAGLLPGAAVAAAGREAHRSRLARGAAALLGGLWSLLAGVGGLVLLMLWSVTDHTAAHANLNLLQFNPLTLALVVLLPAAAFRRPWAMRPALIVAAVAAGLSLLGLVLRSLPITTQANGEVIALALPLHLGVFAAAWLMQHLPRDQAPPSDAP